MGIFRIFELVSVFRRAAVATCFGAAVLSAGPAVADKIENQVAIFSALDKVTARISKFEVELGKTATFGSLKVTPRVCFSRSTTEQPRTTTFVEVEELAQDGSQKRIFTGWMFAESPGLYGVEHPIFDVWLTQCQKPLRTTAQKAPDTPVAKPAATGEGESAPSTAGEDPAAESPAAVEDAPAEPRRRVRR